MALWIAEKVESRSTHVENDRNSTVTLKYAAGGSQNDAVIYDLCAANIPAYYGDLSLQSLDYDHLGGGTWDITATYGMADPQGATYNLDTSGGTAHITQSLETIGRYGNAQNLQGAINFDGERVEGCDISERRFAWNEQYKIPAQLFTQNYKLVVFNLTYTVNVAAFRGFAAGEVIFNGCTASQQGRHPVDVTYYFEASPNLYNYQVGPYTVSVKQGWHYQWVKYQKKESGNRLITQPDGVYIERVYQYGNFALLGIGS